ncbi:hypothetical protein [Novipirellula aureliae]|uniref:hypothetical protein n=1 Tax=Novipirellula aureliae TaxID=2527966 RepID=UPI0011B407A5|nr:hypothetical protein [Novipirellula aureliae]
MPFAFMSLCLSETGGFRVSARRGGCGLRLGETRWLCFASRRDAATMVCVLARRGYCGLRLGEARWLWFASRRDAVAVFRVSARRGYCGLRLGEARWLWFASWRGAVAVVCVLARRGGCGSRLGETRLLERFMGDLRMMTKKNRTGACGLPCGLQVSAGLS